MQFWDELSLDLEFGILLSSSTNTRRIFSTISFCKLAILDESNMLSGWLSYGAQLALRDVEKLIKLQSTWPKAYLRKATAQTLVQQLSLLLICYSLCSCNVEKLVVEVRT